MFLYSKFGIREGQGCLQPLSGEKIPHNLYQQLPSKVADAIRRIPTGIEVEVERAEGLIRVPNWLQVPDGSLRHAGIEFVTRFGLRLEQTLAALQTLEAAMAKEAAKGPGELFTFGERTSVHIHLDVRHWTEAQVQNLLVLYTLFEKSLFGYVNERRQHNIFAIAIRDWDDLGHHGSLDGVVNNLNRYSAINLQAMLKYGTIEYRHMEGNCQPNYIFTWICLLALLHYSAMRMSIQEVRDFIFNIKSSSDYSNAAKKIFFAFHEVLRMDALDTDNAASDAKLFFFE